LKFDESLGDFRKRTKSGKARKPCRTYLELSDYIYKKYGVSDMKLRNLLKRNDAPKYLFRNKYDQKQNSWYDPVEFMSWFKKVNNEISQTSVHQKQEIA
jgi:hypothetical protein